MEAVVVTDERITFIREIRKAQPGKLMKQPGLRENGSHLDVVIRIMTGNSRTVAVDHTHDSYTHGEHDQGLQHPPTATRGLHIHRR